MPFLPSGLFLCSPSRSHHSLLEPVASAVDRCAVFWWRGPLDHALSWRASWGSWDQCSASCSRGSYTRRVSEKTRELWNRPPGFWASFAFSSGLKNDRYLIGVCPVLVFGSIWGIGECLVASFVFADVRFLTGVWAQMSFQVLKAGVRLCTALKLQGTKEGN